MPRCIYFPTIIVYRRFAEDVTVSYPHIIMNKDQKVYTKESDVNFRKPSGASDGVEKMKLGQELIVVDGPWFRVTKDGQQGWVHGDYLTEVVPVSLSPDRSALPQFVMGQPNMAGDGNTIEVRKVINDEFGLGKSGDPLNCTEYAQYRVKIKTGVEIKWPADRPRHGGKWAEIFERNNLYKVINEPVLNCAVSFTDVRRRDGTKTEEGHIAFVEEVLPDGSVRISEANWPHDGIYNERSISKADWQNKYKARFIDFS